MKHELHSENGLTAEGFKHYAAKARTMTPEQLQFAMKDCLECIENGVNSARYSDESSCYHLELQRQEKKKAPKPPIKFFVDMEGYPLCATCANQRKNNPFEKTRPVKEILNPIEKCYWCDAEPTKQEVVNA